MGELQTLMEAEMAKLPRSLMKHFIAGKLKDSGAVANDALIEQIIDRFMNSGEDVFEWDSDGPDIVLSFTEDDEKDIEQALKKLTENLPELFTNVARHAARDMLTRYKREWKKYRPYEQLEFATFQSNLQDRWGEGLDHLRMLLDLSRDVGQEYYERFRRSKSQKNRHLKNVLICLHIRACQVTSEIIALMENGYADGAMARWRTLHEISVVATVIADGGNTLAERYLAHEAVEAKRAMDEYARCHAPLGYKPLSRRNLRQVAAAYYAVLLRFGRDFREQHGWAADHVGNKKPNFSDLEAAAGRAAMRSYYKMASYNVHASPKGISYRIGTIDDPSLLIAGATNAGLVEPGQNTAFSLTQITALLFGPKWKLDDLARMQAMVSLRDEIPDALLRAARKLRGDEVGVRKQTNRRAR